MVSSGADHSTASPSKDEGKGTSTTVRFSFLRSRNPRRKRSGKRKKGARLICVGRDRKFERDCQHFLAGTSWNVIWAQNGLIAMDELSVHQYDAVIIDDSLPLLSASDLVREISNLGLHVSVIAIVESSERKRQITRDFEEGLYAYLEEPLQPELFCKVLDGARDYRRFLLSMKEEQRSCMTMRGCGDIVGRSPAMLDIYKILLQIMNSDVTVAISGESGTGKELVARFLHSFGPRKKMPFVAVNCAAIPYDLLESELFGYEKGAFTGATTQKKGKFEVADKGTVFLDEIGDMDLYLQAKILNVIERGEFNRVGGTDTVKVNVRVISATNQNLEKRIEEGKFREDLYHRIHVFPISLPLLRDREEDILLLAHTILSRLGEKHGSNARFIQSDALEMLSQNDWNGNVRELENVMERAVLLTDSPFLSADNFYFLKDQMEISAQGSVVRPGGYQLGTRGGHALKLKEVEKMVVMAAIERNDGNLSQSARELGISRMTLYRKLKEYGVAEE